MTIERHNQPSQNNGSGVRIIAVDDEPLLAELMRRILEKLGHQVSVFDKPEAALESLRENPDAYDLLITDQTMPEMTGDELAREAVKVTPTLCLVLTTGYGEIGDCHLAADAGFHYFLPKPYTPKALKGAIVEALSKVGG